MSVRIIIGDCRDALRSLPPESVYCCVTSPPYFGLRNYGMAGQIGLEPTPDAFVAEMVAVFRDVRRVLRDDGTLWLNLGDSYNAGRNGGHAGGAKQASLDRHKGIERSGANVHGLKPKDLIGIPWMVAFALRADGWYLRQDIIWSKPNPMPESCTDRCTKAHEYFFLLSKSGRYCYDADAIKEAAERPEGSGNQVPYDVDGQRPGTNANLGGSLHKIGARETRNKRSVWTVATHAFSEAHFATFPPALIEPCIKAGCPEGGTVLDPFGGAGTTGLVADRLRRNAILIELNPEYAAMSARRIDGEAGMLSDVRTETLNPNPEALPA